jgi:hypothetical protein
MMIVAGFALGVFLGVVFVAGPLHDWLNRK